MRVITVLALLMACGTAQASEWMSAGKAPNGDEQFIDVSSIRAVGQLRRVWVKHVPQPQTTKIIDPSVNKEKWVSKAVTRKAIDCGEETARTESLTWYFADGTNFPSPSDSLPTDWEPVTPDSALGIVMEVVCTVKPSSATQEPQWVPVSTNKAETEENYVDVSSIQVTGGTRRAWVKTLVSPQSQHGVGKFATKWIAYKLSRTAFNCREETLRFEDVYIYFDDGTVESALSATPDPWVGAPPDSVVATDMRFICAWKSK
jgi:hypothetical protein